MIIEGKDCGGAWWLSVISWDSAVRMSSVVRTSESPNTSCVVFLSQLETTARAPNPPRNHRRRSWRKTDFKKWNVQALGHLRECTPVDRLIVCSIRTDAAMPVNNASVYSSLAQPQPAEVRTPFNGAMILMFTLTLSGFRNHINVNYKNYLLFLTRRCWFSSHLSSIPKKIFPLQVDTAAVPVFSDPNAAGLLPYENEGRWRFGPLERAFSFTGDCCVAWFCPCVTLAQIAAKVLPKTFHVLTSPLLRAFLHLLLLLFLFFFWWLLPSTWNATSFF